MGKRGQVALFVIIAAVIVAVILAVILYPRVISVANPNFSPGNYLKDCIESDARQTLEVLGAQGGYLRPEGSVRYQDVDIKYLCYTSDYYETCVVQQPLLVENFLDELEGELQGKADQCVVDLKNEYERRGYSVTAGGTSVNASFSLDSLDLVFFAPMTITRGSGESNTFRQFNTRIETRYYELLSIAVSIIDYESNFGDSETTQYIQYYPNLKIEKTKLSDGSTIYKLTDVVSKESFTFASRSLAWPPGYGT